jgi:hypothetical protein
MGAFSKHVMFIIAVYGLPACSDGILETGEYIDEQGIIDNDSNDSETLLEETDTDIVPDTGSDTQTNSDTESDDGTTDTLPECYGGQRFDNLCFYLGEPNHNCIEACESRGGYNERSPEYVGTMIDGGSEENCAAILPSLLGWGYGYVKSWSLQPIGQGLGCHLSTLSGGLFYGWDVPFDETHKNIYARRVCGCGEDLE